MRITRIKLKNFIGIDHGVGLSEIEVNFDNKDSIILFKGANGSGKSTLLSQLHPFKETFDERRYIILPGKEGVKEITILNNGDVYEIKHIYTPKKDGKHTTTSFIQKNGVELNDSGLNSTFEAVIKEEFDITPDYFQIGKIGSNTKLFTDKSVGERKNFICTFLNMEELTIKFKIIDTKVKAMKKDLALIQANINKYRSLETLTVIIDELEKYLSSADTELKKCYQLDGNYSADLTKWEEEKKKYNKADLEFELIEINKKLEGYKEAIASIRKTYGDGLTLQMLENHVKECSEGLILGSQEVAKTSTLKNSKTEERNKLALESERLADEIAGLKSGIDIGELESNINKIESDLKEIGEINVEILALIKDPTIKNDLVAVDRFVSFIQSTVPSMLTNKIVTLSGLISGATNADLQKYKQQNAERLKQANIDVINYTAQINQLQASSDKTMELLNMRPIDCVNNNCPFIQDAIKNKAALEHINDLENNLATAKETLTKAESLGEKIDLLLVEQSEFTRIYAAVKDLKLFKDYWNRQFPITSITDAKMCQDYFNEFITLKESLNEAIEGFNMKQHLETQLEGFKKSLAFENEKMELINNKYVKELNKVNDEIKTLDEEIKTLTESHRVAYQRFSNLTELRAQLNQSIEAISEKKVLDDRKQEIQTNLEKLENIMKSLAEVTTRHDANKSRIHELESNITAKKNELSDYKVEIVSVAELNKTLESINNQYIPMTQIFEALSPSKGIPLILMQVYLNSTEAVTNELLKIAFGDKFHIKFITNEKEFFIQVVKDDGSVKEDVKYVSQGEKSIIETSLALALISQMMTDYNILTIDEIDGPLDHDNRKRFVEILRSQMTRLGSEQFFIISHNDEFDDDGIATLAFSKGAITYTPSN